MPQPLRLLYVDDDEDVRRVGMLSFRLDASLTVSEAASGPAALALIDADPAAFDLFVFDMMMPGMTGLELMAAIEARGDAAAAIPVILMTARARSVDIDAYRAAGAKGVVVKPFDPMRLAADIRAIAELE
jgi:two-component system, OmpR family, response regulator